MWKSNLFWRGGRLVWLRRQNDSWWSRCEWRNIKYPTRAAFLSLSLSLSLSLFLRSHIRFLIAGNLTECVQVQLTWKFSRFFDTWKEAQFSSAIPLVPSLKKKKRKKKRKKLSKARTMIDHNRHNLLSAGNSGNGLFCISTLFALIVTYSGQFTWQGHRKLQWAMSKDETLLSSCPLETAEPSRNYARVPGYKKRRRKRQEKKRMAWKSICARMSLQDYFFAMDYSYAVTLKTKVFGDYNHECVWVSWIISTRGLLLRGYTGSPHWCPLYMNFDFFLIIYQFGSSLSWPEHGMFKGINMAAGWMQESLDFTLWWFLTFCTMMV